MRAFYQAQPEHLRNEVFRRILAQYDVIVANPDCDFEVLHEIAPQATILAYACAHWIPTYGSSMYYAGLRALAENGNWHLRTPGGELIEAPSNAQGGKHPGLELLPSLDVAEGYAEGLRDLLASQTTVGRATRAGVYVDECQGERPAWWLQAMGMDHAHMRGTIIARYRRYTEHLLLHLRRRLAPGTPIVANTSHAGPQWKSLPVEVLRELDGICIEHPTIADLPYFLQAADWQQENGHGGIGIAWYGTLQHAGVVMPGEVFIDD